MLEDGETDEPETDNELKLSSKIAELFVMKKTGLRSTDCANVSLRFRRPESLFSLFLEPALMVRPGPIIIITAKSLVNVNVTAMVMPREMPGCSSRQQLRKSNISLLCPQPGD
jgi:hypothetical protein